MVREREPAPDFTLTSDARRAGQPLGLAIALLLFGLFASFSPGWLAAIILGIYVVVAYGKQRGSGPRAV